MKKEKELLIRFCKYYNLKILKSDNKVNRLYIHNVICNHGMLRSRGYLNIQECYADILNKIVDPNVKHLSHMVSGHVYSINTENFTSIEELELYLDMMGCKRYE